jgi:hypothetical protein
MVVTRQERFIHRRANEAWSMDFVSDQRLHAPGLRRDPSRRDRPDRRGLLRASHRVVQEAPHPD